MATRILFLAIVALSTSVVDAQIWRPYTELEARGTSLRAVGQGKLMIPLDQDAESLLFADLRGIWSEGGATEGNWGMGYRRIVSCEYIVGAYAFYDLRKTELDNRFDQVSFGAELLGCDWGLRLNGYVPDDEVFQSNRANRALLQAGNVVVQQGFEGAYYGADFEYEKMLWSQGCGTSCGWLNAELWTSAGGFYFDHDDGRFDEIAGARFRSELRMFDLPALGCGSRLVVSGQYEYDQQRGSVGTAMLTVRVPFGCCYQITKLCGLNRRMVAPIVRDIDIVTNRGYGPSEAAKFLSTGNMITGTTIIDGSTADPEGDFAAAGADSLVIFQGGAGDILADTTFHFSDGQVALGGGSSVLVVGCDTGSVASFRAPGPRPTIVGTNAGIDVFTLADNNGLIGLNIEGGQFGIFDPDGGTHQIVGNFVTGTGDNGGLIIGDLNGDLVDNEFVDTGVDGFAVTGNLNGDVVNNRFDDNPGRGLFVMGNVAGNVSSNTANDNVEAGIQVDGDIGGTIDNNTTLRNGLASGAGAGIEVNGDVGTGLVPGADAIFDNQSNGNESEGIFVSGDVFGNVANNTTNDSRDEDGIDIFGDVFGDVVNNTANDNGNGSENGLRILGNVTGSVLDNTTNDNLDTGLRVDGIVSGDVAGNQAHRNGNQPSDFGIEINAVDGNVSNNTANDNSDVGIFIDGDVGGSIHNNTALRNGTEGSGSGIEVTGDVGAGLPADSDAIFNNVASDNFEEGIFTLGDTFGNVVNNTTNGNGNSGVNITDVFGDVRDNIANDNGSHGLQFRDAGGGIGVTGDVTGNRTNSNGGNGFFFSDVLAGTVFDGNTSSGNGDDGFEFGDNNGTFANNTANNNGGLGFNGGANNGTANGNSGSGNTGGGNTFP